MKAYSLGSLLLLLQWAQRYWFPLRFWLTIPGPKVTGLIILTSVFTGPALGIALHLWINTTYIAVRNARRQI